MGTVRHPLSATPLAAVLFGRDEYYAAAREALATFFGPPALESDSFPFTVTDYYEKEMGPNLRRRFLFFAHLADPGALADWKIASNDMEKEIARRLRSEKEVAPAASSSSFPVPPRPVNIDVGYLTAAKLVLASTKNFAHRLYLRDGIYAEITLAYRRGAWVRHEFTFPDFKTGRYDEILTRARTCLLRAAHKAREARKTND